MVQSLGAVFYYYGDNITDLMETDCDCNEENDCLRNIRISATITLAVAFVILQFGPQLSQLFHVDVPENEHHKSIWYSALDMVVTTTKIDVLYTTITTLEQTDEICGSIDQIISFILICGSIFVGALLLISKCIQLHQTINEFDKFQFELRCFDKKANKKCIQVIPGCSCFFLIIGLGLFLFADNSQPLDCVYGCNSTIPESSCLNETINKSSCDEIRVSRVKLVLSATSGFIIFLVMIVLVSTDLCLKLQPFPVERLLNKMSRILQHGQDPQNYHIHTNNIAQSLLTGLGPGLAATLLALLPVDRAAQVQATIQVPRMQEILTNNQIPTKRVVEIFATTTIQANRVATIFNGISAARIVEILEPDEMPPDRAMNILKNLPHAKLTEIYQLPANGVLRERLLNVLPNQEDMAQANIPEDLATWVREGPALPPVVVNPAGVVQ